VGRQIHESGHAALIDLPYKSYLVDVLAGPSAWRFIDAVPPELGIIVGPWTSHRIAGRMETLIWAMPGRRRASAAQPRWRVANGSVALVGRHFGHRKAQLCGESVRIHRNGPTEEVAEAIDEKPLTSRSPRAADDGQAVEGGAEAMTRRSVPALA